MPGEPPEGGMPGEPPEGGMPGGFGGGSASFEYAAATEITAEAMPFEIMPTLHSDGSLSARVICNASLTCRRAEIMSFLSEPVKQADPPEEEPYSVAYFYPAKTDTLWSVAKKYRIDPAKLKADNPTSFDESGRLAAGIRTVTVLKG